MLPQCSEPCFAVILGQMRDGVRGINSRKVDGGALRIGVLKQRGWSDLKCQGAVAGVFAKCKSVIKIFHARAVAVKGACAAGGNAGVFRAIQQQRGRTEQRGIGIAVQRRGVSVAQRIQYGNAAIGDDGILKGDCAVADRLGLVDRCGQSIGHDDTLPK